MWAVRPPSTTMAAPVMNDASSEARKSTVLAISPASPTRPIGCAAACWRRRALSLGDLVASHRRFVERETETGT